MMARIESLDDIKEITVHWSESPTLNDALGSDGEGDIEMKVKPKDLDVLIAESAKKIAGGYDKTSMTVELQDGLIWAKALKFYICQGDAGLLNILNKGE